MAVFIGLTISLAIGLSILCAPYRLSDINSRRLSLIFPVSEYRQVDGVLGGGPVLLRPLWLGWALMRPLLVGKFQYESYFGFGPGRPYNSERTMLVFRPQSVASQ